MGDILDLVSIGLESGSLESLVMVMGDTQDVNKDISDCALIPSLNGLIAALPAALIEGFDILYFSCFGY